MFTNLLQLVTIAILARQLSPSDFGLVALAQVLLGFVLILNAGGVSTYIIYDRADGREERVHAAFWVGLVMIGVIIAGFFIALPWVVSFYSEPRLRLVLIAYIVNTLITQLRVVPEGLIKRGMDYQSLVIRDSAFDLIASALKVTMALTGWGIWSLVWPELLMQPLRLIVTYRIARWRPSLHFGFKYWQSIFRYVASISGSNILGAIANDGDTLLIGKLLGTNVLGIYDIAWNTANLATSNIVSIVSEIATPALAEARSNLNRLRNAYDRMLRFLAMLTFPLLIGLFVVADEFVAVLYGPKWAASVLPLRIFILFAIRRSIGSPIGSVLNVMGRPDIAFKFDLCFMPFYLVGIYVGSRWGIIGVAAAVTLVRSAGGFIWMYLAARQIQMSLYRTLHNLSGILLISLVMAICVWLMRMALLIVIPNNTVRLICLVATGGPIYFTLLCVKERALVNESMKILQTLFYRPYSSLRGLAR